MPVQYNHLLQGGYINMPSARMGSEGEIALGYSWVPPYHNWNLRCQVLNQLEFTANYRVFNGIDDPVLSQLGFGDFSDKGANLKIALITPEDSDYQLPGVAVGTDDFLGTRSFKSRYIVATQVFLKQNIEASLGWGEWRIRGFFGGISWMPFRRTGFGLLEGLTLNAEYDAIPYKSKKREPHPDGRIKNFPVNVGVKYQLWNHFDFSASYIRGDDFAFSASAQYNFGQSKGFVPKTDDPLPYRAPVVTEPLGPYRPESAMMQDLIFAFDKQGIDLMESWLFYNDCGEKVLRLSIYNNNYRFEYELRDRLNHLLAYLIPEDIQAVNVVILSEGFPIQEYHYSMPFVRRYGRKCMCGHELKILTPMCEVSYPHVTRGCQLFKQNSRIISYSLLPDFRSYFGSSKGKFKYTLGLSFGFDGYLPSETYYCFRMSSLIFSDIDYIRGVDRLNPSQIINVRTDLPLYLKKRGLVFPELYLRKIWNLGKGWFSRVTAGYFEREYAGLATELLYYPINGCWAFGLEGALLKKRTVTGLGLTDKIRKLHGFKASYQRFIGSQYFANLYYDWKDINMEFRIKGGQFLARDFGLRYEVSRYFESGMRLTMWYTQTNGHDKINGETYYDKGVMISLPLDMLYTCSSRKRWNYGMSAWLRDVGVTANTGGELYYLINDQRQR